MKKIFYIIVMLILAWGWIVFGSGCIHLPSTKLPTPQITAGGQNNGALVSAGAFVKSSASTLAIQKEINWQAGIFIAGGVALLALAGFLGYAGQIIPAVKIGIAGLLLPIFAIWFAYHWILVVVVALIASAIGFIWAERDTQFFKTIYADLLQKFVALQNEFDAKKPRRNKQ